MPRPNKAVVEYFPHMVADSKTKYGLDSKWPHIGYSVMFRLFELLGSSQGHYYEFNNDDGWDYLLLRIKVEDDVAKAILYYLSAKTGTFDHELAELGILWSQNFVNNLAPLYTRRKMGLPTRPEIDEDKRIITPTIKVLPPSSNPEADKRIPAMISYYEDAVGTMMTSVQLGEMQTVAVECSVEVFKEAVNTALEKKPAVIFPYVMGIINNGRVGGAFSKPTGRVIEYTDD